MKMTQCEKIKKFMEVNGTITQRDAIGLGCYRLASRIFDLKKSGINIKTETKRVKNIDGTESYIAIYSLIPEEGDS